jgi:hypothetical protein
MKPISARLICHADDCTNHRSRDKLMCRSCWANVPQDIQRAVYDAYDPAAGIRQSPEWAAAAQRAIASLRPAEA